MFIFHYFNVSSTKVETFANQVEFLRKYRVRVVFLQRVNKYYQS